MTMRIPPSGIVSWLHTLVNIRQSGSGSVLHGNVAEGRQRSDGHGGNGIGRPDGEGVYRSFGLWHFRATIDAPVTLDDFVGQAGKKLLLGDLPPPRRRARENWNTGLRFFEKARKSNFVREIMYPLARWTRDRGTEILDRGVAFLAHIEDNVPILREALTDARNDQPFIADFLLKPAPAVDMELTDEYQGFLRCWRGERSDAATASLFIQPTTPRHGAATGRTE
jgi:hypothetical protein